MKCEQFTTCLRLVALCLVLPNPSSEFNGAAASILSKGIDSAIDHEIKALPGWFPKQLPSRQFSGILDADGDDYLKMHYWFVEAENDPENAPLVLWFNGGPGASSLYGLLIELGPFLLSDLSLSGPEYEATGIPQLIYNPNGWQKVANILALSIPPPVGFSFCNPPGPSAIGTDCGAWNDTSTAEVTHYAINSWMKLFPQYKSNEMYLLGESYAGVYVPTIVQQILAHPEDGFNLKGFGVGDACTPPEICGSKKYGPYFSIQFLYGKAAFSNQLYEQIMSTCTSAELIDGDMSVRCSEVVSRIDDEVGGFWVYGYYDTCWYENDIRRRQLQWKRAADEVEGAEQDLSLPRQQQYYGPPIIPTGTAARIGGSRSPGDVGVKTGEEVGTTPNEEQFIGGNGYACGGPNAQVIYLDRPEVKKALNLPEDAQFFQCDNGENFTYEETEKDLISWYKDVIADGNLRIVVYNGDTDPCISTFQAQNWTRNLGFKETQSWRPWTLDGCQNMGGYVTRYENNFDFVSIKGSGHMVPLHRPQATLEFVSSFLFGNDYQHYDGSCSTGVRVEDSTFRVKTSRAGKVIETDERKKEILEEIATAEELHRRKLAGLHQRLLEL